MSSRAGWRPLTGSPGFYVAEDGTMHVDEAEAIRACGYEPTEGSRRALRAAAADLAERCGFVVELEP